jgi:hypothetical protein
MFTNKVKFYSAIFLILPVIACTTIKKNEFYPQNNKPETQNTVTQDQISPKRIVILYHGTKFRDEIVKHLVEKLVADNIEVIIDDASKGKNYDPKQYDQVVVFSGIHAFIPDAYPNDYLFRHKNEKNIIKVFYTYLTRKGVTVKTGIEDKFDTITAASMKINSEELVKNIYDLIKSKI